MQNLTNKRKKGFTLIELIVVMAILAILVLLAAPRLLNYTKEATATQIRNDVRVVEGKLEEYLIRNNSNMPEGLEVIEKSEIEAKVAEDLVHDIRGLVSSVAGDEFYKLKDTQRSKLKGDFIANKDGKVYYIHIKAVGGGSGKIEDTEDVVDENNCPIIPAGEMKPIDAPFDREVTIVNPESLEYMQIQFSELLSELLPMMLEGIDMDEVNLDILFYDYNGVEYIYISVDNSYIIDILIVAIDDLFYLFAELSDFITNDSYTHHENYVDDYGESFGNPNLIPKYIQNYDENGKLIGCPELFNREAEDEADSGDNGIDFENGIKEINNYFILTNSNDLYYLHNEGEVLSYKKALENVSSIYNSYSQANKQELIVQTIDNTLYIIDYEYGNINIRFSIENAPIKTIENAYKRGVGILIEDGRVLDVEGNEIGENVDMLYASDGDFYAKMGNNIYIYDISGSFKYWSHFAPWDFEVDKFLGLRYNHQNAYILSEGKIYASGDNDYGQRGNGSKEFSSGFTPVSISDSYDLIDMNGSSGADGKHYVLALDEGGRLWGWGFAPGLGINNIDDDALITPMIISENVKEFIIWGNGNTLILHKNKELSVIDEDGLRKINHIGEIDSLEYPYLTSGNALYRVDGFYVATIEHVADNVQSRYNPEMINSSYPYVIRKNNGDYHIIDENESYEYKKLDGIESNELLLGIQVIDVDDVRYVVLLKDTGITYLSLGLYGGLTG